MLLGAILKSCRICQTRCSMITAIFLLQTNYEEFNDSNLFYEEPPSTSVVYRSKHVKVIENYQRIIR